MMSQISVNMEKMAKYVNTSLPGFILFFGAMGHVVSFYFHFFTVAFIMLTILNFFYRHVQRSHTLLSNYGILALARYMTESIGPELR